MNRLAHEIVFNTDDYTLTIDGEEFPWYFGDDWKVVSGGIAEFHLAILAERVVIADKRSIGEGEHA